MSDYIPFFQNFGKDANLFVLLEQLKKFSIVEASSEELFTWNNIVPSEIEEIELGVDETEETIIRLPNDNFVVLNGTTILK